MTKANGIDYDAVAAMRYELMAASRDVAAGAGAGDPFVSGYRAAIQDAMAMLTNAIHIANSEKSK